MFKNTPKILAHISSIKNNNFVTPEYILNKGTNSVNLFNRYCPHRMYPMHVPGTTTNEIVCNLHNFKWDINGTPLNNSKKINCGNADIGRSGLIFKDFKEPYHFWVDDLEKEQDLQYSHSYIGKGNGSWLWTMDIQNDLLHIHKEIGGIHPELAHAINLDEVEMYIGDDNWVLQTHKTGWWLFIYPYTFIEYGRHGCLCVNYITPNTDTNEFGFEWISQYYYSPLVTPLQREEFETLDLAFNQDVTAAEKQKGPYFPLMNTTNRLEEHCVHFGKWVKNNLIKN